MPSFLLRMLTFLQRDYLTLKNDKETALSDFNGSFFILVTQEAGKYGRRKLYCISPECNVQMIPNTGNKK